MPSYFRITCTNPLNRSALDRDATRNLLETAVNNRVGPLPPVPNERLRHILIGWGGLARTPRDAPQEPHYGDAVAICLSRLVSGSRIPRRKRSRAGTPPSSCPPTKSAPWGAQRLGGESPYPLQHAIAIF